MDWGLLLSLSWTRVQMLWTASLDSFSSTNTRAADRYTARSNWSSKLLSENNMACIFPASQSSPLLKVKNSWHASVLNSFFISYIYNTSKVLLSALGMHVRIISRFLLSLHVKA